MSKQSLNLSIDEESLARGQRYSQQHGVSISSLVDSFLAHLPLDDRGTGALPADVRDLIGIGTGRADRDRYREHLRKKYG